MSSSSDGADDARPKDSKPRDLAEIGKLGIVSFFGLGLAPVMPGTFGTLGAIPFALLLDSAPGLPYWAWLLIATLLCFVLGVALGGWAERYFGKKDAGAIVIDEVAGYFVTVAIFALFRDRSLSFAGYLAAFFLFRVFDITKPPPGRALESFPKGVGVMLDDIVLAVYAGLCLAVLPEFWEGVCL